MSGWRGRRYIRFQILVARRHALAADLLGSCRGKVALEELLSDYLGSNYPSSRDKSPSLRRELMKRKRQLGDLQLAIMRVLWERGEAPAIEVHQALFEERGLAVTTIKTMLRKLEEYGCVEHRAKGMQFIYRSAIAEADVRRGMVSELVHRLFYGDSAALVNHLVQSGELSPEDLEDVREIVSRKRKGGMK